MKRYCACSLFSWVTTKLLIKDVAKPSTIDVNLEVVGERGRWDITVRRLLGRTVNFQEAEFSQVYQTLTIIKYGSY